MWSFWDHYSPPLIFDIDVVNWAHEASKLSRSQRDELTNPRAAATPAREFFRIGITDSRKNTKEYWQLLKII